MKKNTTIILFCILMLAGCANQSYKYPTVGEQETIEFEPGKYKFENNEYDAKFGTIVLSENREVEKSRKISLPLIWIPSKSLSKKPPIFILNGGPGTSNMSLRPPEYLLQEHDLVIVGYRGADGSSVLHCPEVNEALDTKEEVLSDDYLEIIGDAWKKCHQRITKAGVDLNSYTMLDVIEDMEQVRKKLGFEKINLLSASYGTRVAYLYGLKHPNSLHRTIMIGATPPGHFGWEPEVIDAQIEHYAKLCASDIKCSSRTSDLTQTMKNVLNNMPDSWLAFGINKSKVKLATFVSLYHRNEAAKVFDAYIAAENGDPSGLALLTLAYDFSMPNSVIWGDFAAKSYSADFDSKRQYAKEMDPTDSVMGSPLGKLAWGSLELSNWPTAMIPDQYRYIRESNVETLVLSGSVDFSTPAEWTSKELAPNLKRGKHIILAELGHRRDIYNVNPEVTQELITNYFLTGTVDESKVKYTQMNFESSWGWPDVAKFGMSAISIAGLTLLIVL